MHRKNITVFITLVCIATLLTACTRNGEEASIGSNGEARLDVLELRLAIEKILTTASKGSGNPMAEIGGFSDKLDAIKTESNAIKEKSDGIYDKIASDDTGVAENLEAIRKALDEKMSAVKAAKGEKDINKLKPALNALLTEIEAYGAYLDTVAENMDAIA